MDLGARIGWGIVIYAVVFLVSALSGIYGWVQGPTAPLVDLFALIVVCIWAGSQLRYHTWSDILQYSIGWAVITAALDSIYAVPLEGWGLYQTWGAWVSYLLVATLPLLSVYVRKRQAPARGSWES